MIPIRRLVSAHFETPDIDRQAAYYTDILGLSETERNDGIVYLASVGDHHSVTLRQGFKARCVGLTFQVAPASDLKAFANQVSSFGTKPEIRNDPEPSIARAVTFQDPKGTQINVFADHDGAPQHYSEKGIVPVKLGHVAFNAPDVVSLAKFYCEALGFRLSDQIEDFFLFLRCGPDHHTINFVQKPDAKMHHIAFELRDLAHVQLSSDFLGHRGYPLIWGPGRHLRGHNIFTYHRNADEQIVELFTQLDQMPDEAIGHFEPRPWHATYPHRPQRWSADIRATNLWGVLAPPGFLD